MNASSPKTKRTALHFAALEGNNDLVEVLLTWGATVDQQDHSGSAPLYYACQEGHVDCVLTLSKAGANLSLPQGTLTMDWKHWSGGHPIHVAAVGNHVQVLKTLLELGCSPNAVSINMINKFYKKNLLNFLFR